LMLQFGDTIVEYFDNLMQISNLCVGLSLHPTQLNIIK
jgi:hypothetical protein